LRGPRGARRAVGGVPGGARPLLLPRRELPDDRPRARDPVRDDREPDLALPREAARALRGMTTTLLFTDIEGSTRLLRDLGDEYAGALAEHRRIVREAFAAHGGREIDTQGDAFFYAFEAPVQAVAAAEAAQAALAGGPIRVRMGVHTAEPTRTEEGYVGIDVHLGARIAAAGHGGQVLLSKATRDLIDDAVRDLGEHRVKDFDEPVWIYQPGDEAF